MGQTAKPKPTTFTTAVHAALRDEVEKRDWSFRRLAEESGIGKNRISRTVSRDETPLGVNELDSICSALRVSPLSILRAAQDLLDTSLLATA